jgi:hypothetical protein
MTEPKPLFVFGIARSGTNLIARMLDLHPSVEIALDPFLALFKSFRNAAQSAAGLPFDPGAPFQDYYFAPGSAAALDAILAADLSLPLDPAELPALRERIAGRAGLEAADIPPFLARLSGATYREAFASGLALVAAARASAITEWVGVKELWTLEFLPTLARAFPDAKFIIVERDPRAVIASLQAMADRDPTQAAHAPSYLRHWRKGIVLARRFAADAALGPRLAIVRYEDVVADLAAHARLCRFLDLVESAAPDLRRAPDRIAGGEWLGNSSFGALHGVSPASLDRWRDNLTPAAVAAAEIMCGPEMMRAGYAASLAEPAPGALLDFLAASDRAPGGWRSDSGDAFAEFGNEVSRSLIAAGQIEPGRDTLRRCFLVDG